MPILVSKNGGQTVKVNKTKFKDEDVLQAYITKHPEVIPVDEIEENIKVFIAAREFQTKSGPIDAIGFDRQGNIYIIETKLYTNPDKRIVIAQVLDYGASLWKHGNDFQQFINSINDKVNNQFKCTLEEKLISFFGLEENEVNDTIEGIKNSLNEADFKFLIVMDKLVDNLKDLIIFLNSNSQFDVYAVELEYYKVAEYEIIIPSLFGNEVKKEVTSSSQSGRRIWTKEIFFQEATKALASDDIAKLNKFYEFGEKNEFDITYGTGSVTGSFAPKIEAANGETVSIFHAKTNGEIEVISWYWKSYKETIAILPSIIQEINTKTSIKLNPKNKVYICKISNLTLDDMNNLFQIYSDAIKKIEKMNLSFNPGNK
ncbi:MAG: hypothetical protein WCJ58_04575 [bacterium]